MVALYRDDTTAAAALEKELDGVIVEQVDIADTSACAGLVDRVLCQHGRVDHLVDNAGLLLEAASTDTPTSRPGSGW